MQRRSVFLCLLALLVTVLVASASITTTERSATLSFLKEFADEYDVLKYQWTGSDYCSWPYVTCDASDDVHVDLSYAGLDGDMPEVKKTWGPNSRVVSIDLSHNPDLDDDFESDFKYLTKLRSLDLSYTRLKGSIPSEWNALSALETVQIHHTRACRDLPNWNGRSMPNLRVVDFSYNNFQGSLLSDWSSFQNLQSLNLAGNTFCACTPASWAGNAVLQSAVSGLSVASATCAQNSCKNYKTCAKTLSYAPSVPGATTTIDASTLSFLREFIDEYEVLESFWTGSNYCGWDGVTCDANGDVHVDLSHRGLTGGMPDVKKTWGPGSRVVSIDLSHNPGLDDDFKGDFKYLTQLRSLDLSYTQLEGYIPDQWRSMSALETVQIHHTRACRNLPDWNSGSMPNLRVVDFSYNNFQGSLRSDWSSFQNLQSLNLAGNTFCACTPSAWTGNAVLQSAVSGLSVSSATCAQNSCSNYKTCAKTVNPLGNFYGAYTGSSTSSTSTARPAQTTTSSTTAAPIVTDAPTTAPGLDATGLFLAQFRTAFPAALSSWTGSSYCTWTGVSCSGTEVTVSLKNAGLVGTMPDVPSHVDGAAVKVVSIDLSGNSRLTGNFRDSWASLKQLRWLDLSSTALYGDLPSSWNGMSSLQEVYIRNTKACRNLPNWGSDMISLRIVDLSNNELNARMVESWSAIPNLQRVDISGNGFCGCMPTTWATSPVLKSAASAYPKAVSTSCGLLNMCLGTNYACAIA